jgi:hypothetical protein
MGLQDGGGQLLAEAAQLWPAWLEAVPQLGVVATLAELRPWLSSANAGDADRVLLALARLGSPTGGDSVAAAGALAWALLPGACSLARRLSTLTPVIDEVVAAQLWIEVRAFPWQRLTKVAANILANTRSGVLRECGVRSQLERSDLTWSRTSVADPHSPAWDSRMVSATHGGSLCGEATSEVTAVEELLELLEWACVSDVITAADRSLLLSLVDAAERSGTRRTGRGQGGLMANDVSEAVASRWGISPVTVRRRARRTVEALSVACIEGRFAA